MQTFYFLASLLASASLAASYIVPNGHNGQHHHEQQCGTCNPLSGENHCDASTSCINTGSQFHCACRAGYKATPANGDVSKQFRLDIPHFNFLVFTPEHTVCNTPCENTYGIGPDLCAEVPVHKECTL